MTDFWKMKLPLKIKIFLWMLWHDRVQTGEQLKVRKGKGSKRCKYCGKFETRSHLLFNCNISQIICIWVRISLRWAERPTSLQHYEDMMGFGVGHVTDNTTFFVLASVAWSLWKTRNNWVFNNVLIKSPKVITHMILGFLSQWKKLLKLLEALKMEDIIMKLQDGLKAW
jgi:hypothetical protein